MGMRFRKSFGVKGARINLSKSGVGFSIGTKGARYSKMSNGRTRTTMSIPGTGISYVKESGGSRSKSNGSGCENDIAETPAWLLKAARVSALFFCLLSLLLSFALMPAGLIILPFTIGSFLAARRFKKELNRRKAIDNIEMDNNK